MLNKKKKLDLPYKISYFISTGFGSGLSKFAPGTVGTLWAWVIFLILDSIFTYQVWLVFIIFSFFLGMFFSSLVEKKIKKKDPSEIVIDEMVAFWLLLFSLSNLQDIQMLMVVFEISDWFFQLLAFIFFRFFDILKPWPISFFDKNYSGGFGIMIDDLLAAILSFLLIVIITKIFILAF